MTINKTQPQSEGQPTESNPSAELIGSPNHRWIAIILVSVCCLVLLAVVIPAIQRARYAAQRTQSKNNLKQLGLAFLNYHDVYDQFPIGADVRGDGTAVHGWTIRLVPYMESSPLYSKINKNLAWDHPANSYLFRFSHWAFVNPTVEPRYTTDGFGLTHYLGNPNVVHRNSTVSLSDMTTGSSHNWLVGEISGRYQPFAFPFNWRPLMLPLNDGKGSYGSFEDSGQFCLADGAVRTLSEKADQSIIQQLTNAPPVATAAETALPDRVFEYSGTRSWSRESYPAQNEDWMIKLKSVFGTTLYFDPAGNLDMAEVYSRSDGQPAYSSDGSTRIDLPGIIERYPEVRSIVIEALTDDACASLKKCTALETLVVEQIEITESGRDVLKGLKTLKRIDLRSGVEYSPSNVPVNQKVDSD